MSRMLNLAEGLLSMGRTHQRFGRVREALTILSRLSRFRELPPGVAEETQARLGEIQLKRRKFRRAQRHLTVALRYDPDNARYHQMLAAALGEPEEQRERAVDHYRRALELDPEQVECRTELGFLYIRLGKADEGIVELRRAVELRPDDPEVLGKLAKGLRWAGRLDEARQALRLGLFRNGRDRRFQMLWSDFQFRLLRREQLRQQCKKGAVNGEGPVLLPFPAPVEKKAPASPAAVSAGEPPAVPVPCGPRPGRTIDRRQVR